MDFMDDDMKAIARKGYEKAGAVLLNGWALWVYAACEAVLAEQKRRQSAGAQEPQMDATMADAVRHPAQQASLGELTPDELSRFRQRLNIPAELVRQPAPNEPRMDQVFLAQAAAALAVAREGMVPASLKLTDVQWKWIEGESERLHDNPNDERDTELDFECKLFRSLLANRSQSEQQLATMYSLEQIDKALNETDKDFRIKGSSILVDFVAKFRARLTTQQQATEQERVTIGSESRGICSVFLDRVFVISLPRKDAETYATGLRAELAELGKGGK